MSPEMSGQIGGPREDLLTELASVSVLARLHLLLRDREWLGASILEGTLEKRQEGRRGESIHRRETRHQWTVLLRVLVVVQRVRSGTVFLKMGLRETGRKTHTRSRLADRSKGEVSGSEVVGVFLPCGECSLPGLL